MLEVQILHTRLQGMWPTVCLCFWLLCVCASGCKLRPSKLNIQPV